MGVAGDARRHRRRQVTFTTQSVCDSLFVVAAFDYHFGALDNTENELAKAYNNMMYAMRCQSGSSNELTVTSAG